MDEIRKQQGKKQEWVKCDPVTLVAAAKQTLYQDIPPNQREQLGPLEEVVSRFEHQTRAALGASEQFAGTV